MGNLISNMAIVLHFLVISIPARNREISICGMFHIFNIASNTNTVYISTQCIQPFVSLHKSHIKSPKQTASKSHMATVSITGAYFI